MANDTAYGLGAYVWSSDIDLAITTAHRLEAGWVQVNQGGGQVVGQSYGGFKQRGIGRGGSPQGCSPASPTPSRTTCAPARGPPRPPPRGPHAPGGRPPSRPGVGGEPP